MWPGAMAMWILDSAFRSGVDLWCKEAEGTGAVTRVHHDYNPPFLLHLPDPDRHHELIAALEEQYPGRGLHVPDDLRASRRLGGTRGPGHGRSDRAAGEFRGTVLQRGRAPGPALPCRARARPLRGRPLLTVHPVSPARTRRDGDPHPRQSRTGPDLHGRGGYSTRRTGRTERLQGEGKTVLADLLALADACDPDVILMSHADLWMQKLVAGAEQLGLPRRSPGPGKYRTMGSRSYWSYGRMEHKAAALIP